ncbi:hypothetical protein [Janthinobacterium sp.]|uniref:hypothetical protein n=1 Tax=Janthinobacterium sp. TaxID=1871054 RepID=UPI00293D324D|nr:hypothetical protein [Janthinobacterium sp.]
MKQLLFICAAFTSMGVSAQVVAPSGVPLPSPPGRAVSDGRVFELVSVENMPMKPPPSEIENLRAGFKLKADDGVSHIEKSNSKVKNFFEHNKAAAGYLSANEMRASQPGVAKGRPVVPEVHRDLSAMKLSFKPAAFQRASLTAAAPAGTIVNGRWSGVERFFKIPDAGVAALTEIDLAATHGKYSMLKEAVNGAVNGGPAVSKVVMSDAGDSIEEVVWMNGSVYSHLVFGPNVVTAANGAKMKAVKQVSALSLAQELR